MTDDNGTNAATDDAANAAALAAALAGTTNGPDDENGDGDNGAAATGATDETGADGEKNGDGETAPTAEALAELTAQLETLKAESRKWEDRSKANFKELEALKRNGMTDEEKAAHDAAATSQAVTEATTRAEKAEAALLRKTIAVDLSLSKEHAAILDGINGDETALRALAAALAASKPAGDKGKAPGGVIPTQGAQAGNGARTLGDMFAESMGDLGL